MNSNRAALRNAAVQPKQLLRKLGMNTIKSRPWKATSRWIRGSAAIEQLDEKYDGSGLETPAIAYFPDVPEKLYQLLQWLPVLEKLNTTHPVAIVLRSPRSLLALREITDLPLVLKRRFDPLQDFYYEISPKIVFYMNNGSRNFQSLAYPTAVHIHVNHGESDKLSMVSNQVKAYDRVFVAGQAAVERHEKKLIEFDFSKLVVVGRPQLDIPRPVLLPRSTATTIMYAPTWEGENYSNNYTSVDKFGVDVVRAALNTPGARVIYKPHPRVQKSKDPLMATANQAILDLIATANENATTSAYHQVVDDGDILGMFEAVDLMITDISSVGLDFLYLHPEKPLILTDRRSDPDALHAEAPISRVTPIIDETNLSTVDEVLHDAFTSDKMADAREKMRAFYFGNDLPGQSLNRFISTVDRILLERAAQLAASPTHSASSKPIDD